LLAGKTASAAILYVWQDSPSPGPPHATWATAAHTIQDAVEAAAPGDEIVVTNGVYATGGRAVGTDLLTNRVAVDKPLTLRSVNGPGATRIQGRQLPGAFPYGDGAIRCVYLAAGASLCGVTLTGGGTRDLGDSREQNGGGLWCESEAAAVSNCCVLGNVARSSGGGVYSGTLSHCVLEGNRAYEWRGGGVCTGVLDHCTLTNNRAAYGGGAADSRLGRCHLSWNYASEGGGAYGGTLNNCWLTRNSAIGGGGAFEATLSNCALYQNEAGVLGGGTVSSTLNNCTLVANVAYEFPGGGAVEGVLNNCIVQLNTAITNPYGIPFSYTANYFGGELNYCCTVPLPTNGVGNITTGPIFVDDSRGNLRIESCACVNAGNNACAQGATDLDGRPRIVGGTVDIGAYEFQGAGMGSFIGWLEQFALATDGSADATDPDADGHNNWQEWRCHTDPTNPLSVLRLLSAPPDDMNVAVTWQSAAGVNYFLDRGANLSATSRFTLVATNLPGQPGTTTFTDTNAVGALPRFYRVGVPAP
jgi:hypothetical protein